MILAGFLEIMYRIATIPQPMMNRSVETASLEDVSAPGAPEANAKITPKKKQMIAPIEPNMVLKSISTTSPFYQFNFMSRNSATELWAVYPKTVAISGLSRPLILEMAFCLK